MTSKRRSMEYDPCVQPVTRSRRRFGRGVRRAAGDGLGLRPAALTGLGGNLAPGWLNNAKTREAIRARLA
jgi:hypothetical protein